MATRVLFMYGSDATEDQRLLHFSNCLGDFNATWASVGAVEGGAATPHAFLLIQDLQATLSCCIAAVEDEAVSGNDGCWAEVLIVSPVDRARSGAASAQDALGAIVELCAIFSRLKALLGWLVTFWDQERQH